MKEKEGVIEIKEFPRNWKIAARLIA